MTDLPSLPVHVEGLTWTGAGVWTGVVILVGNIVKETVKSWKNRDDRDSSLRKDLLARVRQLEEDGIDQRREAAAEAAKLRLEHDKAMADQRRECAAETTELRALIEGLQAQLVAISRSTGHAIHFGANAPTTEAKMSHLIDKLSDVPGVGE